MNQIGPSIKILLVIAGFLCCGAAGWAQSTRHAEVAGQSEEKPAVLQSSPPLGLLTLRVQGNRFIDAEGRQVILHGLNVVSKSKSDGYLSWHRATDFAAMRRWGMNCVRLGIIWDALEPEPGHFDEAYLDQVAKQIDWATKSGLYVFLDMHQDLYSVLYGDGAPEWATLHENRPHIKGHVWSDAYMVSPAVQVAFDNFWANAAESDGLGLQDHYAAAWQQVAKRFADNPTVIGYDIMNEPFQGSSAMALQRALLQSDFGMKLAERLGGAVRSPAEIGEFWLQPAGRKAITAELNDIELYRAFLKAQEKISQTFEREQLQPFYQRVAHAIRKVDPLSILLLETGSQCNAGVPSGIEPIEDQNGKRDAQQAYAPHGYDIVVDTPLYSEPNEQRAKLIFDRHGQTARRLAMPLLVGEWGAFDGADEKILPNARVLQRQIEKLGCSDTYWHYDKSIENKPFFAVLKRSIPQRIVGELLEYENDSAANTFRCCWKEQGDITAPTIIYLTRATLKGHSIRLEPQGHGFQMQPVSRSGDVTISIAPTGKSCERLLLVE